MPGVVTTVCSASQSSPHRRRSFARLAGTLRPEAPRILLVIALAILSVTCAVVGPKILGNATDILFDGVVSQQIPAGLTQQQAVDALRAAGQTQQANLLESLTLTPGQGVDFTALRNTLLFVAVVYILSSLFALGRRELAGDPSLAHDEDPVAHPQDLGQLR